MAKSKSLETVWEMEPHTAAKHAILQKYLQAWLPIMSKYHGRVVYVDGFAGPGVYAEGEAGSPILALKAYLDHTQRSKMEDTEFVYVFIEEDRKRVLQLREEIEKLGKLPANVLIEVIEGAFQDEFSRVLDSIDESGKDLAPTFAFIDPFGYSDAPMSLSGRFLEFARCEVLIYVPLRQLNRFVGAKNPPEQALNSLFGTDEWRKAADLDTGERLRFLHDLFYAQLKDECALKYVRSFEIISSENASSGYTLFFGTNHELGLQRMKESMWSIDPIEGQRYKDTTSAKMEALFEPQVDTTNLRLAMFRYFGTEPFTIEDAVRFTLLETPYIPTHVKTRTLKPIEKAGKLEVLSDREKKGTYPDGTVMRFKP